VLGLQTDRPEIGIASLTGLIPKPNERRKIMNIITVEAKLYTRYPRQTNGQPVYLEIDPKTETMRMAINGEIGNAVPMDVWHGVRLRYTLNIIPTIDAANALMEDAEPLAERIIAGHEIKWDGSNHCGYLNDDAIAAQEELEMIVDRMGENPDDHQQVWDEEYLSEDLRKITAGTTSDEITEMVDDIEQSASLENAVIDFDVREELERRREEAREN